MLSLEQRKKFLNKEIKNAKEYLKMTDIIKEVAAKFIGKVYNRRFREALQEAINARLETEENKYYVTAEPLANLFYIEARRSQSFMTFRQNEHSNDIVMYRNHRHTFMLSPESTEPTDSGKLRFAEEMLQALEEHKEKIKEDIKRRETDLTLCEEVIAEAGKIRQAMEEFSSKYSYELRDAMGVSYECKNISDYAFRF